MKTPKTILNIRPIYNSDLVFISTAKLPVPVMKISVFYGTNKTKFLTFFFEEIDYKKWFYRRGRCLSYLFKPKLPIYTEE